MTISLESLAKLTDSIVMGDPRLLLEGVGDLEMAGDTEISFVSNPKYKKLLANTKASAVILSPELVGSYSGNMLINDDPYLTFAKVVFAFHGKKNEDVNIHPTAMISQNASISDNVNIAENVVIGEGVIIKSGCHIGAGTVIGNNTTIQKDTFIYPNVTIYKDTIIGARAIIHAGVILGSDGFGFAPQKDQSWYKILQIGNVIIGDDVEIGAGTTIDRAALGSTAISDGVKIDNQVQIAHNVKIGKHTAIAGGTMIAGSTVVGAYCQFGGMVGIAGHLVIADGVIVTGKGMVTGSIKQAGVYSSGVSLEENRKWRRNAARFRSLDEMAKRLKKLERKIERYEQ